MADYYISCEELAESWYKVNEADYCISIHKETIFTKILNIIKRLLGL